MKSKLALLIILIASSIAHAHAGHGDDPVHYAAGIDGWIVGALIGVAVVGIAAVAWVSIRERRRG